MMLSHEHFMKQALEEARKALAENEFPVGCVLVVGNEVIARGRRANTGQNARNELDHAEIVALRQINISSQDCHPGRIIAYCTMEPCLMCYAALMLSQVRKIVFAYEDAMGGGTALPVARLNPLYRQIDMEVIPHVLRRESLDLFKQFFLNPSHDYWRDSYLAAYTLEQK
ncbi:MAG: nucleoside deaminase [Deltaproteobacteria bacterium]|nr:nucleoside deaminase [Deltaproteobacteria bacterium]